MKPKTNPQNNWSRKFWSKTPRRQYNPVAKKIILDWLLNSINKIRSEEKTKTNWVTILDVGSGSIPLFKKLPIKNYTSVSIDIIPTYKKDQSHIVFNLNAPTNTKEYFFFINTLEKKIAYSTQNPTVDFLFFSEILNYVDYQKTLNLFTPYLRAGGTIIILNQPGRGEKDAFSPKGVKKNTDLINFIKNKLEFEVSYNQLDIGKNIQKFIILFGTKQ